MKNAYAKKQAELRRQLLNYGALVGQQFNVDMMCLALNEEGFDPDVIERQLAHAERNKVRAAYHRAEYLDDRRKLLQWLADFYESQQGGNVRPVNFHRAG